jgi:hypothetical protein
MPYPIAKVRFCGHFDEPRELRHEYKSVGVRAPEWRQLRTEPGRNLGSTAKLLKPGESPPARLEILELTSCGWEPLQSSLTGESGSPQWANAF